MSNARDRMPKQETILVTLNKGFSWLSVRYFVLNENMLIETCFRRSDSGERKISCARKNKLGVLTEVSLFFSPLTIFPSRLYSLFERLKQVIQTKALGNKLSNVYFVLQKSGLLRFSPTRNTIKSMRNKLQNRCEAKLLVLHLTKFLSPFVSHSECQEKLAEDKFVSILLKMSKDQRNWRSY